MNATNNITSRHNAHHASDSILWSNYAKSLKAVGMSGLLLGLSDIWFVVNMAFVHLPAGSFIVLFATFIFVFYCFRMIYEGKRSMANMVMWVGIAYIGIAALFRTLDWPGGMILEMYGVANLITIITAIVYLIQLPQEQKWARLILGTWTVLIPLISCTLWYVMFFYQNYVWNANAFEPAIPYANHCVEYVRHRMIRTRVMTLGSGVTLFACSLPLYIVARKHSK